MRQQARSTSGGFVMRLLLAARLSRLVAEPKGPGKPGPQMARRESIQTGLDSQERKAIPWAESQGHTIVGVAADYAKGTLHLWERPNLRPWVTEPELLAQYDGLLCLKVDRLTRADDKGVDALKKWARDNGKQILISSAEVHFPSEGVEGLLWDAYIRMAHQEWLGIQERFVRMLDTKNDAGSLTGPPPWGYEIVKTEDGKTLAPTPEGRIWVPRIFTWAAEGQSMRWIAEQLDTAGVKPQRTDKPWAESSLAALLRRTTFSGTRVRKQRAGLRVEPLVSRALQDKAVAMLESRAPGKTGIKYPKQLLAKLKCGNPECPGEGAWPMYKNKQTHYRCDGKQPQKKGCGAPMIRMSTLDALVLGFSAYWDDHPYIAQRFVSGNDAGAELELLRAEMADAMRMAKSKAERREVSDKYEDRIEALESEKSVQPHWEDVETGLTEGEHLRSLDLDGQRTYLARKEIKAWQEPSGRVNVWVDGALARTGGMSAVGDPEE